MPTNIVLRQDKTVPLTYAEMDQNLINLRDTADLALSTATNGTGGGSNEITKISITLSSTAENQPILSIDDSTCVKCVIHASDTNISVASEILMMYDTASQNVMLTEYGIIGTQISTYSAIYTSGTMVLRASPVYPNTTFKIIFSHF